MRVQCHAEIEALNRQIRELAELVMNQVRRAAEAAATGNVANAESVARNDMDVELRWERIDETCMTILPLCAPVTAELHSVFGITKVNHELERIGALARRIAHHSGVLALGGLPATARDIALLAKLATVSCARAINAFITQNVDEAHAARQDHALLHEVHKRLSTRFEEALGQPGVSCPALLAGCAVVASLAQIGDHTTRIAKVVAFMQPGEVAY